ncbi:MAG: GAF domain-containing protein [Acidobacteriota bacterium]
MQPVLVCTGTAGDGVRGFSRRTVARDDPFARDLFRDKRPVLLDRTEFAARARAWIADAPPDAAACLAVALAGEGAPAPAGLLFLFFAAKPKTDAVADRLQSLVKQAAAALERALRAERRSAGMRQAIERLTALYDLSKAFGSTIEWADLTGIVVRKAVDFAGAETGSLWLLDRAGESVELAASAINESYEIADPPESVGASVIGDLLADRAVLRRNRIPSDDPVAAADPAYPVRSLLAVPLEEDEALIGALVLANKRGRVPEFTGEDQELLEDLARQAVRALRNARQYEAEKKVAELDALLAVSREITATLDLDKVMQTIVNATAALVQYDLCAISILDRGRLRVGAVSGMAELDRKNPEVKRTEDLLQWVFFSGADVNVTQGEDGSVSADRPETEEKFRAYFQESGSKAFFGVILKDDEGKLGVLGFESHEPIVYDAETRDLLQILVNQATVAVRNAQLYQQVPLAGFLKPMMEKRRRLVEMPKRRRIAWAIGLGVVLLLALVPWRLRISGPARVVPGRRSAVTAGVDGVVRTVRHREGDVVAAGEVLGTLNDEAHQAALAEARAARQIAAGELARARAAGNAATSFQAESRIRELDARVAMEEEQLADTELKAPTAGVIITPRLEERVGQNLERGAEFCVVADVATLTAEIAVAEEDSSLILPGQAVAIKLNPYPTRTFPGVVSRIGARVRQEEKERFVIVEARLDNRQASIKTGTVGSGKIRAGSRSIATLVLRKPARWFYAKIWPLLP